jgi:hypothetical protein
MYNFNIVNEEIMTRAVVLYGGLPIRATTKWSGQIHWKTI